MNTTRPLRWWLPILLVFFAVAGSRAAEVLPSAPTRYFNDYAGVVSPETADRLNTQLEDLEKQSSNQILVAIYPTMQTDSSLEDYCYRITASWHVGQKGKDNGAVLFVFVKDHRSRIETRPGLEGALPDATGKDIVSDLLAPKLQQTPPDYDGGLTAVVGAMVKATGGENKGTGRTADEGQQGGGDIGAGGIILIVVAIVLFIVLGIRFPGLFNALGVIFNILSMFSGGSTNYGGGSSSRGGGWSSGGGSSSGGGGGASGDW